MFKVNNKDTKWHQWHRFGVFIVNFEHISHLCSSVSIANFEQVNAGWVTSRLSCRVHKYQIRALPVSLLFLSCK